MMIDKNSPVAIYIQVKELLLEQIYSGELQVGRRLPSERELSEQLGISRNPIRQALGELIRDGLVEKTPGKGTFVTEKYEGEFDPLTSFTEQIRNQGQFPSSRVLAGTRVIQATRGLAEQLQIPHQSKVARIERLRLANGRPRVLQTAYLPLNLCPHIHELDFEKESLFQVLSDKYRLVPVRADNSFEARLAEPHERELLHLPDPSAILIMRQTSYLVDGRAIEYTKSIYQPKERFHSAFGLSVAPEDDL